MNVITIKGMMIFNFPFICSVILVDILYMFIKIRKCFCIFSYYCVNGKYRTKAHGLVSLSKGGRVGIWAPPIGAWEK